MAANKKKKRWIKWVCFIVYLLLLGYMLFYSGYFGRTEHEEFRYNLTLFQEIVRFYNVGVRSGNWNLFALNVLGNICVFIPLGMFLPSLFIKCKSFVYTTFLTFELSLCVEIVQLVTKVGSFDVDDLMLNSIGGAIGYIIYRIYKGTKRRRR